MSNYKGMKQIQWEDRLQIRGMIRAKAGVNQIAKETGFCRRTIQYELKRGMCVQQHDGEFVMEYCADYAELKYQEHLRAKGPDLKIGHDHAFAKCVEDLIKNKHFSPGAALAEIRNNPELCFSTEICESTLYNYVYRGDVFFELGPEHLPNKGEKHKQRSNEPPKRARLPKGETIENRPPDILDRLEFGHWEMDSVMGCRGCKSALVVLTERKTRDGIIIHVPDHTMESVVRALNSLERKFAGLFKLLFKSITVDNGSEFQDCAGMEKSCRTRTPRTKIFYCHPYSAYERGSNENMNKIIRRFFPKGTNFDEVTKEQVEEAQTWMNNYPRKVLGWRTAASLFEECVAAVA